MADRELEALKESLRPHFQGAPTPKGPSTSPSTSPAPTPDISHLSEVMSVLSQLTLSVQTLGTELRVLKTAVEDIKAEKNASDQTDLMPLLVQIKNQQASLQEGVSEIIKQLGYSSTDQDK